MFKTLSRQGVVERCCESHAGFAVLPVQDCEEPSFTDGHPAIYPDKQGRFNTAMPQELKNHFSFDYAGLINALNDHRDTARTNELLARQKVAKLEDQTLLWLPSLLHRRLGPGERCWKRCLNEA